VVNGKDAAVKEQDGGLGEGDAHVVQDIGRERDLEVVVELGDGIGGDVVARAADRGRRDQEGTDQYAHVKEE